MFIIYLQNTRIISSSFTTLISKKRQQITYLNNCISLNVFNDEQQSSSVFYSLITRIIAAVQKREVVG